MISDKKRQRNLRKRHCNRINGLDRMGFYAMSVHYNERDEDFMIRAAQKYARLYQLAKAKGEFANNTKRGRRIFAKFKMVIAMANDVIEKS